MNFLYFLQNIRGVICLLGIVLVLYGIIASLAKYLYRKFKKFDYKLVYSKFKPKDKIKITFVDKGKVTTTKAKIISISDKVISFENKEAVFECTPSEIKDIRKRNKKFLTIVLCIWVIIILDFIYAYATTSDKICCYEGFPDPETGEVTGGGCGECGRYL